MPAGAAEDAVSRSFIGRSGELAALAELAAKARIGQLQLGRVQGPAGIGKSALLTRFGTGLDDFTVLTASGDPAETLYDFGLVEQLLVRLPRDVREQVGWLDTALPAGMNPIVVATRLQQAFGELQARSPVAVMIDDVQWADTPSLQALRHLLRRSWSERLLILLAARDEPAEPGSALQLLWQSVPSDLELELGGLEPVDIGEMARTLYGTRLALTTVRRFHAYSKGQPLLLRTMLREICTGDTNVSRTLSVPASIGLRVRDTLAGLPDDARRLLEAIAVLGGSPTLAQAAHVAGLADPAAALGPAIDAGLASWDPAEPTSPVSITHDLQREAIYAAISPARRSDLHRRAASTVERLLAWRHRVAAATSTDPALAAELQSAARTEAIRGDHRTAATFLTWAAALTPWGPVSERLTLSAMVHYIYSPLHGRARELVPKVRACGPSPLRSLAVGLYELFLTAELHDAERHLLEAFSRPAAGSPDLPIRAMAAAGLTGISIWRGGSEQALRYAEIALAASGVPTTQRDWTYCLRATATARKSGLEAALRTLEHLPGQPHEATRHQLEALACRGALRSLTGAVEAARADLTEVVLRQENGSPIISGVQPFCYLTALQYQAGEWDDAVRTMRRAELLADDEERSNNVTIRHLAAAMVPAARGDWARAEYHVTTAAASARRVGSPQDLRYAAIATALLRHAQDDFRGVLTALDGVPGLRGSKPPGGQHEWWSLWWSPLLVEALLRTGLVDEAAVESEWMLQRIGDSSAFAAVRVRPQALLAEARGDLERAVRLTADCLTARTDTPVTLADGLCLHDQARRLRALGDHRQADRHFEAAVNSLTALGATPYRDRAALDRRQVPTTPPDRLAPLTAREREVAELVRRDLTNREIAATLHVSTKTVEYHLSNIYTKLGATRRSLRQVT